MISFNTFNLKEKKQLLSTDSQLRVRLFRTEIPPQSVRCPIQILLLRHSVFKPVVLVGTSFSHLRIWYGLRSRRQIQGCTFHVDTRQIAPVIISLLRFFHQERPWHHALYVIVLQKKMFSPRHRAMFLYLF